MVAALESTILMSLHKAGLGQFTLPGLLKATVVKVPAKKKRFGRASEAQLREGDRAWEGSVERQP